MYFGGMLLGSAITGILAGILGAVILSALLSDGYAGWGGLVGAIMGMAIGYPVGVFIGLVIFRKLLRYNGSLILGLIGVIVGGILPFVLAEPLSLILNTIFLWAAIIISPPLLGTVGFNLRKKSTQKSSVLPEISSGTIDSAGHP